jgi:quercetin dioxygenase-like cupin family protein
MSASRVGFGLMALVFSAAQAHPAPEPVPSAEYARAAALNAAGPSQTTGVSAIRALGELPLATELQSPDLPRVLRARELVIDPGGVVAVHEHQGRPGVAYLIEGELIEHRSDADAPLRRQAGDAAFESSGLVHWWENRSERPARALVVDLVPQ